MAPTSPKKEEEEGGRGLSTLSWCVCTLAILYVVGGNVFSWLERDAELKVVEKNRELFAHMRDMYEFEKCEQEPFRSMDFCRKQKEFKEVLKRHLDRSGTEIRDHEKWTFYGACFYLTTLVTTLGYGNLHPLTTGGRSFTVIFGLIGIPVMGYVLSHIGRFIVETMDRTCSYLETTNRRVVLLSAMMIFLILLGGLVFSHLEGWTFLQACYFSACTLCTIGFGDLLPSKTWASRPVCVLFIFGGLGVAATLMALLQIHVEIRGEQFAKRMSSWYDAVAGDCSGSTAAVEEGQNARARY
jgi:hypothetical protein